jgi:hypothetical protein
MWLVLRLSGPVIYTACRLRLRTGLYSTTSGCSIVYSASGCDVALMY